MSDEPKPLSKRHQRVLDEYLMCWSQTNAYWKAYPKITYDSAKASAARLFADVNFLAHLEARLEEVHMSADEALQRLSDFARGDMGELMDVSSVGFNLDMAKAQEAGLTKLIKKVKQRTTTFIAKKESEEDREVTELEVELYSAHEAVRDVLKIHGKFIDRVDLTSKGKQLKGYAVVSPDDWKDDDNNGS